MPSFHGTRKKAVISPGVVPEIRTRSWYPSLCSSRRRSPRSSHSMMSGCDASPISPLLPPRRSKKYCAPGRVSAITRELVISARHTNRYRKIWGPFSQAFGRNPGPAGSWPLHRERRRHVCLQPNRSGRRGEYRASARSPIQSTNSD